MTRLHLLAVLSLSLSVVPACSHSRGSKTGVSGPGMNARREASLLELASTRLSCPAEQLVPAFVETDEKNLHLYRVAGCNRTFNALLHCIGACMWVEMPDERVAQELACPVEQLQLRHVDGGSYEYAGCGRVGTYTHRNNHWEGGPAVAK